MGNNLAILKMMPNKFKNGSVVLITGASSGIGREMALRYASRSCRLLLCARSEQKLLEVCSTLGGKAEICVADVSKEADCKRMVEECLKVFLKIDLLVLNAGVNAHARFEDINDLAVFRKVMETNFYGYVYPTKFALSALQKVKGQIVVLSSLSGEIGLPYRTAYCSSKFAVTGFFESLRTELRSREVAITIVCPPSVKSNMRDHDIMKIMKSEDTSDETDTRMSVQDCVDVIMLAADRRARKVFFPLKAYIAAYLRPILPDFVDKKLKQVAKL